MIIKSKTKMKDVTRAAYLSKYSQTKFIDEIKKFEVPKRLSLIKVTNIQSISMSDMFQIWDVKDNNKLMELTKRIFICNKWYKKLLYKIIYRNENNLPLIDFTRLIIQTEEIGTTAAKLFSNLKVISTDERVDAILKKYKGDKMDMIARFCRMFPAYTVKTAMQVSWYDIYLAFKTETKDNNIQIEISKLKPL